MATEAVTDWVQDESMSREETLARFHTLNPEATVWRQATSGHTNLGTPVLAGGLTAIGNWFRLGHTTISGSAR